MTKKEIRETKTLDLASRLYLLSSNVNGDIEYSLGEDMTKLEEIATIDRELKRRLGRQMKFKNSEIMKLIKKGTTVFAGLFPKEVIH